MKKHQPVVSTIPLKEAVRSFADNAVEHFHEFKEFRFLYYSTPKQIDLLNASAKGFFSDLFYLYLDRVVLNVSRLTDPTYTANQLNLTVRTIHELCSKETRYPVQEAEILAVNLEKIAGKTKQWRHKRVAHIDFNVAVEISQITEQVVPSEIEEFYGELQKYITLIYDAIFLDVFDIDAVSLFGADALVQTLKEGVALRKLLDKNTSLYGQIYRAIHEIDSLSVLR